MPEGDTIFRSARTLHLALAGHEVVRFDTRYAHLQRVHDEAPITGRRVEAVTSRGKHLLVTFTGGLVLRTHMRMSGSWHVYRPGEAWKLPRGQMRLVLATAAFEAVAFNVQEAEFLEAPDLARSSVGRLGPDLLAPDFDDADALRRLRARDGDALGEVLLDQRVVAGIGNVYRSEVLFLARRHPDTPVRALTDEDLRALLGLARRLLRANVLPTSGPGIVTRHSLRRTTGREAPGAALWVYQREGLPCRTCGTPVARARRGPDARVVWWCPRCQPVPAL